MRHLRLSRQSHRPRPGQSLLGGPELAQARVHEACGPARHTLALMLAREMSGPVFWIAPTWETARLNAPGIAELGCAPGRIIFVAASHVTDLLWSLEEALRSGAVPLVVGDLPAPPGLTPMRRLQLAAEAGAAAGLRPLGLVLTPEGGAVGSESRWHMTPEHCATGSAWRLARLKARDAPPRIWQVRSKGNGFALAPEQETG